MKHVWLAIDPGITTGWALMDDQGTILATSVWGTAELKPSLDTLIRTIFSSGKSITAVIEKMPNTGAMGPLGQKLEAVRRDILMVVQETYEIPIMYVMPGTWKPSRVAKTTKLPAAFNQSPLMVHQKDAIRMGRYAMEVARVPKA